MTPKEAHEFARRVSMPCPCCGQPVVLCVSGPDETRAAAEQLAQLIAFMREHGTVELVSAETCAQEIIDGVGTPARPARQPS